MESMHPPQNPERRETTVRDLVAVVFRQKWMIITVFAVATLAVFVLNLRSPTTYESRSRVRVERGRKDSSLDAYTKILPWSEEISSEIETVKSYPVEERAQQILDDWSKKGELSQPIRMIRGGVAAGVIGESNVIEISYESQDASVCRPVTDAVTKAYSDFRQQSLSFPEASKFFSEAIPRAEKELESLRTRKETYLGTVGIGGSKARESDVAYLLQDTEGNLLTTNRDLGQAQRNLATAEALADSSHLDVAYLAELKLQNAPTLLHLREEVIKAQMERDGLAATLTPQHPKLRAAEENLASAEGMLRDEVASTLGVLRAQIAQLSARKGELEAQRTRLSAELSELPQVEEQLADLDNSISLKQAELRDLKQKELLNQVNQATTPEYTVTLLSPASAPQAKKTKDYVRMGLAPLMSLVVGLLLAFFLDSLDHSLRGPSDVEEYLNLPVLAALPESRD